LASTFDTASLETTGSAPRGALAYASASEPAPAARVRPMGVNIPQLSREGGMTVAKADMAIGGQRADSPWLRAAMLTPSVSGFMTATRLGTVDLRPLQDLLHKPAQSLAMTFSTDPNLGMVAGRFTGNAVVFLATARFAPQTTASLR
jgi:hypothetical protein